jgi:hypothetical protein
MVYGIYYKNKAFCLLLEFGNLGMQCKRKTYTIVACLSANNIEMNVHMVERPKSKIVPKYHMIYSPIFLALSHMFGYLEQKQLGRSRKSLVFLKYNFFGNEKFQVSAHVLPK